jgi:hypothetical protein
MNDNEWDEITTMNPSLSRWKIQLSRPEGEAFLLLR